MRRVGVQLGGDLRILAAFGPSRTGFGESGTIGEGDFDELDESEPTGSSAFDLASLGTYLTITGPAWDRVTRPEEAPGSVTFEEEATGCLRGLPLGFAATTS